MAPTTISLARLLQLRVAVAWQEAVEVTRLAGALSDASGIPLRLSGTLISSAGGVELAGPVPDAGEPALSMPQLLAVLLEGRSAPPELRAYLASAADPLSGFPSERDREAPPPSNLYWFAGPNPDELIGQLARRALSADEAISTIEEPEPVDPVQ